MRYGKRHKETTQGNPLFEFPHVPCLRPREELLAGLGLTGVQRMPKNPASHLLVPLSLGGIPWDLYHRQLYPVPPHLENYSCYCPQIQIHYPCATSQQLHGQERYLIICFRVAQARMVGGVLQIKGAPQDFPGHYLYTDI